MADDDTLPPPLEIPWRLASTTLPFSNGEPDQTPISIFTHIPDDDVLTAKFPAEKLVYIKVTVSISPASFPITPPFPSGALGEGIPVYHMLLDLKVRRKSGETGTIRPYFHAAAQQRFAAVGSDAERRRAHFSARHAAGGTRRRSYSSAGAAGTISAPNR